MGLNIGDIAPDFSLYASDKQLITLSEQRGSTILLLFFPLAFTSVCTEELCSVRDSLTVYHQLNTRPFGISVDSIHSLRKFKEEQNLNFPLLSDFNKVVSKQYDCLYEKFGYDMEGVSKRAAFLIDERGIIRYAEVLENAGLQPDFKQIRNTLEQIGV